MTTALVLHRADGPRGSPSFRKAAFGKDDPFARVREIGWEGPGSTIAGRVSFIGHLDIRSFPHTESLVVLDGELRLKAARAAPLVIGPGAGVVIACGTAVHVQARFRVRFVSCAVACERSTRRGLTLLRAGAEFHPSAVLVAGAGDALFVPEGAAIGWESSERVAEFHVVQSVLA